MVLNGMLFFFLIENDLSTKKNSGVNTASVRIKEILMPFKNIIFLITHPKMHDHINWNIKKLITHPNMHDHINWKYKKVPGAKL